MPLSRQGRLGTIALSGLSKVLSTVQPLRGLFGVAGDTPRYQRRWFDRRGACHRPTGGYRRACRSERIRHGGFKSQCQLLRSRRAHIGVLADRGALQGVGGPGRLKSSRSDLSERTSACLQIGAHSARRVQVPVPAAQISVSAHRRACRSERTSGRWRARQARVQLLRSW